MENLIFDDRFHDNMDEFEIECKVFEAEYSKELIDDTVCKFVHLKIIINASHNNYVGIPDCGG